MQPEIFIIDKACRVPMVSAMSNQNNSLKHIVIFFIFLFPFGVFAKGTAIKEKITIKNESKQVIDGVRIESTFQNQKDSVNQKIKIAPGKSRSFELNVWQGGVFTVKVNYRYKGVDKVSRPFTANLNTGNAITPVTLKFGGDEWGLWKGVIWDEPK